MTLTMNFIPMWKTKWILKTLDKSGIEATMGIFFYFPPNFCKTILSCYFLRSCFHSGLATHQKTQPGQFIILSKRQSLPKVGGLDVEIITQLKLSALLVSQEGSNPSIIPSPPCPHSPTNRLRGTKDSFTSLPVNKEEHKASPTKLQSLLKTTFTK